MIPKKRGWSRDLLSIAVALTFCAAAGLLRYGADVFRREHAAFQLLTVGLAGSLTLVGYRRGGWRGAMLLAYLVLFVQYLLLGNLGHRESSPALIWVLVVGLFLVAAVIVFVRARPFMGFGRFILVSLIVGAGFTAGTVVLGLVLHFTSIGESAQVNFAVGSLAGAALGLSFEVSERIWQQWFRDPLRG
jgi:hypothetical protein